MNPLHLGGFGVEILTSNPKPHAELKITVGRKTSPDPERYQFLPRTMEYDSIILENATGLVSLAALRWLSKHNIPITFLDFNGETISTILPPTPVKADLRVAQIQASTNPEKKLAVAKAFAQGKLTHSLSVLESLSERYDIEAELRAAKGEAMNALRAQTVNELRTAEGRTAREYWNAFRKILPESLHFEGRAVTHSNRNASDPMNATLNFAYGFLKVACRMAINTVGLEPAVGFLHETSAQQTAESLVYDFEEPFRFLADVTVIRAFESQTFSPYDFAYQKDDYLFRIEPEARTRLRTRLIEAFNNRIPYKGRMCTWDFVIEQKALELARFLTGKTDDLSFQEPEPILTRDDTEEVRARILSLSQSQARALGIQKSTLHYLREKAREPSSFKLYGHVRRKLLDG